MARVLDSCVVAIACVRGKSAHHPDPGHKATQEGSWGRFFLPRRATGVSAHIAAQQGEGQRSGTFGTGGRGRNDLKIHPPPGFCRSSCNGEGLNCD